MRFRNLVTVLLLLFFSLNSVVILPVQAKGKRFGGPVFVEGYHRSDGTYVQPYWRSAPDGFTFNNKSGKGSRKFRISKFQFKKFASKKKTYNP